MTSSLSPARLAAATAAALALAVPSAARADVQWSPTPSPVAEGAPGAEPETGRRMSNAAALAPDGTGWLAAITSDDATGTFTPPATFRLRVSERAPGAVWAEPTTLATVDRVAETQFDRITDADIAVDGAGRPTVAWLVRSASASTVYARTRGADGSWSAPATLGSTPASGTLNTTLELSVGLDGSAAVGWQGLDGVYLAVRPAGGAWGATPETVSAFTTDVLDTVGVGRDQDGAITVVYRGGAANASRTIEARTRTSGGAWGAVQTLSAAPGFAARPGVAVDLAGAAIATWGSADGPRAAHRAAGQASFGTTQALASGSANAAPTSESTTNAGTGIPSAAFDAHGTATVVWPEKDTASRVRLRAVSPAGTWGDAESIPASEGTSTNPPAWPRAVAGPDGALTVAWTPVVSVVSVSPLTLAGGQINVASRSSAGSAWSAATTFVTPANGSFGEVSALGFEASANLSVAGDALGNVLLGWSPYATSVAPGTRENLTVDGEAGTAMRLDWTARGIAASSSLRSWAGYLSSNWPSVGACTAGVAGIQALAPATQPAPGDARTWRLPQADAYRAPDGRTIVQYAGTIRMANTAHCIDNRLTNPRLEIAADGATARVYTDGQASGSMADAMAGTAKPVAVSGVRLLDLELGTPRRSGDGSVRSWIGVPATLAGAAGTAFGMETYINRPFGRLTISIPASLPVREPQPPARGDEPAPAPAPAVPTPAAPPAAPARPATSATRRVLATLKGAKTGKRTATLTLARTLGANPRRTYRVRLVAGGRTVATGTLKGRTLRLTVKRTAQRGRKARYPRLRGSYVLRGSGLKTAALTIR